MKKYQTIELQKKDEVFTVYFNRPLVHNAFNEEMIQELIHAVKFLMNKGDVRLLTFTGRGKSFCAGADINWMRETLNYSYKENLKQTNKLSELFDLIYRFPAPTIAKINGAAIGGGNGFVAACDFAIASKDAEFSLSEVKIGLIPACISFYLLRKISEAKCRELFLSGERFSADKALQIGLVYKITSVKLLDKSVSDLVKVLLYNSPQALRICKDLFYDILAMTPKQIKKYTSRVLADLRVSKEGQEGMSAFLEKRKPNWIKDYV